MAAATPSRDRTKVQTGNSAELRSSSLIPAKTPAIMTMAILEAMPVYLKKSLGGLFFENFFSSLLVNFFYLFNLGAHTA
jgi:hypothetical protein